MPVPNPEQTCSLFSFLTYSYITPIIRLGQQVEHLDAEKLPPLSDSDASKHLVEKAIPVGSKLLAHKVFLAHINIIAYGPL